MSTPSPDDFEDCDNICLDCLADEHLQRLVRPRSRSAECCVCGSEEALAIQVGSLAEIVDGSLRRHFGWGEEIRRFRDEDDDSGWTTRRGYDMSELLDVVLPANFPIPNTLQRLIGEQDPNSDPHDGGEPFWVDDMRYQELLPALEEERAEWDRVAKELTCERRFFSRRAEEFFNWLFEGIDEFFAPDGSVVRNFHPATSLYRGRRCDLLTDVQCIAADPSKELGPPPSAVAAAGRMNAAGVPVLYGALERNTCVAELRPPLAGQVAVAEFRLTRSIKLLDFQRLARAHNINRPSIFRPDYAKLIARRRFTVAVHQLIRTPVVQGRESDYLITQAMAEYLAHLRKPAFEGVLFGSAQDDTGTNVVLFEPSSLIRYVPDSTTFHQITHVKYSSKELQPYPAGGKPTCLFDPMETFDRL